MSGDHKYPNLLNRTNGKSCADVLTNLAIMAMTPTAVLIVALLVVMVMLSVVIHRSKNTSEKTVTHNRKRIGKFTMDHSDTETCSDPCSDADWSDEDNIPLRRLAETKQNIAKKHSSDSRPNEKMATRVTKSKSKHEYM